MVTFEENSEGCGGPLMQAPINQKGIALAAQRWIHYRHRVAQRTRSCKSSAGDRKTWRFVVKKGLATGVRQDA